ncbi:MAG: hypothetical protein ACI81L_001557 [Verrucomicrobiales bacterium]|jgi:hypothetical protein
MSRPVRLASGVDGDIAAQFDGRAIERFWKLDMAAAVELLGVDGVWDSLPEHGGGRRLTVEGLSVGAFHAFVATDELDARPDAFVVYAVDIWPDGFL